MSSAALFLRFNGQMQQKQKHLLRSVRDAYIDYGVPYVGGKTAAAVDGALRFNKVHHEWRPLRTLASPYGDLTAYALRRKT